jgi:DNA modification methylase
MGTGTTGIVAQEYNLKFTGIEIDQDYFVFAKNRIEGIKKNKWHD